MPNYSFCTDSFYKKHSRWLKPFKFRKIPAVLFLLHKPLLSFFPKKIQSFFLKRWKIEAGKSPSRIVWNENENESKFFLFANESFQTKKETSPPFKYNIFAKDIFFNWILQNFENLFFQEFTYANYVKYIFLHEYNFASPGQLGVNFFPLKFLLWRQSVKNVTNL